MRYLHGRACPSCRAARPTTLLAEVEAERMPRQGASTSEDLIHMPDTGFFRRRGVPAFTMTGFEGETFERARGLRRLICGATCPSPTSRAATSATTSRP